MVGGVIANLLGTGDVFELNVLGSIVAIITAAVLIVAIDRASVSRRYGCNAAMRRVATIASHGPSGSLHHRVRDGVRCTVVDR